MPSEIVIIGAGASGLMAGCELLKKGHSVTIVEARERAGGRIHTLKQKFTIPTEAGAEFIHGKYPLTLKLLEAAGAGISKISTNRYQLWKGHIGKGDFLEEEWDRFGKALQKQRRDMDMASFMDCHFPKLQNRDVYQRIKGYIEGFDVGDINKISVMALKKEWGGADEDHQYHIHGGYAELIKYLAEKFSDKGGIIRFSSPVHQIAWKKNKIRIIATAGSYDCNKVIITVPMGVLQKGSIKFDPPVPAFDEAFKNIGFGGVIKFLLEFKTRFWLRAARPGLRNPSFIISDAAIPTWWTQLPEKNCLLTGWFGGPSTLSESHTSESLLDTPFFRCITFSKLLSTRSAISSPHRTLPIGCRILSRVGRTPTTW